MAEREKRERDEKEASKLLRPPPRRGWEQSWVDEHSASYAKKIRALEEKRQLEANTREQEVLKECSFTPRFLSQEAPRQRRLLKARQGLEDLAAQQHEWLLRLQALRSEEDRLQHASGDFEVYCEASEAFQYRSLAQDAQERGVAERRCRIGVLQVLHELTRLETEAFALVSRALRLPSRTSSQVPVSTPAAAERLRELCPNFDLDLLPRLRSEATRMPLDAWEVPGALLRPPLPIPVTIAPTFVAGPTPDEARPWTWS